MPTFTNSILRLLVFTSLLVTGCAPEEKAADWVYDFGPVLLGSYVTVPFELFNPGPSDRITEDVDLESDGDELTLTPPETRPPYLLVPGGQLHMEVTYDPADEAPDAATFRVYDENGVAFVAIFSGIGAP